MNRLIRFYNKNRKIIWAYILIAIAAITLLQILNNYAKIVNETNKQKETTTITTRKDNIKQNYSVTTNETIDKKANETLVTKIDVFVNYCNNGFVDSAYNLLSDECKQELYPTKEDFENGYYKDLFSKKRIYTAQLWTNNGSRYTYRMSFFEDMITTGNVNQLEKEDYYTLVYENGRYKLNIKGFIGKEEINKQAERDDITIIVKDRITYLDYEKYSFEVINDTNNNVLLNSGEKTNKVYIEDENEVRYIAHMYELSNEEITVYSNSSTNVTIKFQKVYKPTIREEKIVFADIVEDYNSYLQGEKINKISMLIEL